MRVIAITNQKGGCGKTTTSINLGAGLAHLGKKVLIVDLDPQGHSTCGLGIQVEGHPYHLYHLMSPFEKKPPAVVDCLATVDENLYVLPTHSILAHVEEELAGRVDREKRLRAILNRLMDENRYFDYVLVDCPPNLGILTYNALEAADEVIIPIEPSFFSLHGLAKISETLETLNQQRAESIRTHALLTIFDDRTKFVEEVYEEVKNHFGTRLFKSIIHECVDLKEAASAGQSIVSYNLESIACRDYLNLAKEYLDRDWNRALPESELGWNRVMDDRFGPKKVVGGVLFQALSSRAREVEIAGDFNGWIPEPMRACHDFKGVWHLVVPVTRGHYRYKFIVDGEWQIDPYYPVQKKNDHGSYDSYLEVS